MAIGTRAAGTWALGTTQNRQVTIPTGYQDGDLGILVAFWRPFDTTATINQGWREIVDESPGTEPNAVGAGSTRLFVAYKVLTASETNPTVSRSTAVTPEGAVIVVLSKDATEQWSIEKLADAVEQVMGSTAMSHVLTTTTEITSGDWIFNLTGVGDDSSSFILGTTAISGGPTWAGNVADYPTAHGSTTLGNDGAGDLFYRVAGSSVASGQSITVAATLSAAERVASVLFRVAVTVKPTTFAEDFESGTLDAWTRVNNNAGTVEVIAGAAHAGSFGLHIAEAASSTPVNVRKEMAASDQIRVSGWFRTDTEGAAGNNNAWLRIFAGSQRLLDLYVQNTTGELWLRTTTTAPSTFAFNQLTATGTMLLDTWYELAIYADYNGAGAVSRVIVWLNGVSVYDSSTHTIAAGQFDMVQLGAEHNNQYVDIWIDDLAVDMAPTLGTTYSQALAVSSTWTVTESDIYTAARTLAVADPWSPGIVRETRKVLSSGSGWTVGVTKEVRKGIALASAWAVEILTQTVGGAQTFLQSLEVTGSWTVAIAETASYVRTLSVAGTWAAAQTRVTSKQLAAGGSWSASVTKQVAVALAVTSTFVADVRKVASVSLPVSSSFAVGLATGLRLTKAISVAGSWVADVSRSIIVGGGEGSGSSGWLRRLLHLRK